MVENEMHIRPEDEDAIAEMKKQGKKNVFSKEGIAQLMDSKWFDPLLRKSEIERVQAFFLQIGLPKAAENVIDILESEAITDGDKNRQLRASERVLESVNMLASANQSVYSIQFNQQNNFFSDPMIKSLIDQHTKALYDANMFDDLEEEGGKQNGK